jgi:hypothetical protein
VSLWTGALLLGLGMVAGGLLALAACVVWAIRNNPFR